MKKKHYIKDISDIKYCEENGIDIIQGKDEKHVFENGCWVYYLKDEAVLYNVGIRIGNGLFYYEETTEATHEDIGKLCWFKDNDGKEYVAVLYEYDEYSKMPYTCIGGFYKHCRPLTKAEIQEFMEKAE